MNDVKQKVRAFVLDRFLKGESESNLRDDTPLRTSGIVDSLGTIELVTYVEEAFGIELEAHETGVEHFDSVGDIATLVSRKMDAS